MAHRVVGVGHNGYAGCGGEGREVAGKAQDGCSGHSAEGHTDGGMVVRGSIAPWRGRTMVRGEHDNMGTRRST